MARTALILFLHLFLIATPASAENSGLSGGFFDDGFNPSPAQESSYKIVFYITNREIKSPSEKRALIRADEIFSNSTNSSQTSYGYLKLYVPKEYAAGRKRYRIDVNNDERFPFFGYKSHVPVNNSEDFRSLVEREVRPAGRSLLFVHGYDTSFRYGAYEAIALSHDLSVAGASLLFSWASDGPPLPANRSRAQLPAQNLRAYRAAQNAAVLNRPLLQGAIRDFSNTSAAPFDVIAHSLGTDVAAHALASLHNPESDNRYFIMGAADMSTRYFVANLSSALTRTLGHMTSYCADDAILALSGLINPPDQRLGFCNKPKNNVEGVDLVTIRGPSNSEGNHSYIFSSREVQTDIKTLLLERHGQAGNRLLFMK